MFVTLEILKNQEFLPTPGNLEFFDMIATDLRLAPIDAAQRAASIGISEIPQNAKSTFFWACKVITCCAALRAARSDRVATVVLVVGSSGCDQPGTGSILFPQDRVDPIPTGKSQLFIRAGCRNRRFLGTVGS